MLVNSRIYRYSIIFCALFFNLSFLIGQNISISGSVVDNEEKKPVIGATVIVDGTSNGAFTDEEGKFTISTARKDEITLKIRYLGMKDTSATFTTAPGQDSYEVEISMQTEGLVMKDEVITAGRHKQDLAKVPASMEVINPEKVDLQASNEIEDALQQGSGVDIIDGQPNIRGSSGYAYGVGSRVMVMLDGLPLLSADASFAQFDLIPTDNINQIEIMKGASSVLYGSSALGGVINVITSDAPEKPKTSVRLRGTAYGVPHHPEMDWDGNKSAKAGAISVFHSRKIKNQDITLLADFWKDQGYRSNTDEENGRFMVMTKFRPAKISGLTFGANASARFDSSNTFLFWDSYYPQDTMIPFGSTDTVFNAGGAYSGANSARSQFNTRYTFDPFIKYLTKKNNLHQYRGRLMRTVNTNNTNQSAKNAVLYNDYQYSTHFWHDRLNFVGGGTFQANFANGDSLYGGSYVNDAGDTIVYDGQHASQNIAVYAQIDAQLTSKLSFTLGGRFDRWHIDGEKIEQAPIGRIGLNYELYKGGNVRASFGQAFRSPSIAERYTSTFASGLLIEPNPTIEVEKGYSAEIGYRQGFLFGTKKKSLVGFIDVAGFLMDYKNMIQFGLVPLDSGASILDIKPVFQAQNVDNAHITGLELTGMAQVTINKFRFDFNGGITYINPVNENPAPDSAQADLINYLGPQSNPFNFDALGILYFMMKPDGDPDKLYDNPKTLKYRSNWTNRFSASLGYGRYSITANYRYKSQILAMDQFLMVAIPGSADFLRMHPGGFTTVDFILGAKVIEGLKVSLNVNNAFNQEYAVLPGLIGKQRHYILQMKYVF